MNNRSQFIESVSEKNIKVNKLEAPLKDVSGMVRNVPYIIYPKNKAEIQLILKYANQYLVQIYPISCGKNWGFGSSLPSENDTIVVNLKDFNTIVDIDLENGYATVTPGVTQELLAHALKDTAYFIDVTGSSADSSLIGNALERGIAYNSLRVENISELEILLPNGKFINTGFSSLKNTNTSNYPWGIGPSLDGLFFQSNFGIVTQAKIKLMKRTINAKAFCVTLKNERDLFLFISSLKPLLENNLINCIPHIFNKERFYPGMAPLLWKYFQNIHQEKNRDEILHILKKQFDGEWFVAGNLRGFTEQINLGVKHLKKITPSSSKLQFIGAKEKTLIKIIKKLPFFNELKAFIYATDELGDLTCGNPTNLTLPSINWAIPGNEKSLFDLDIDGCGDGGFLYFTPMSNYTQYDIALLLKTTMQIASKFYLVPAITLNAITPDIMEGVISVAFNKHNAFEVENAHKCIKEMNKTMIDLNLLPYRTNIDMMDLITFKKDYASTLIKLKQIFDPNHILSNGRYIPSEESIRNVSKLAA